jgi:hypothetical protein
MIQCLNVLLSAVCLETSVTIIFLQLSQKQHPENLEKYFGQNATCLCVIIPESEPGFHVLQYLCFSMDASSIVSMYNAYSGRWVKTRALKS